MRNFWLHAYLLFFSCPVAGASITCPPARPHVQVEHLNSNVEEFFDTTIAELRLAAQRLNVTLRHPILGTYVSSIGIRVDIKGSDVGLGGSDQCPSPETIYVRLGLLGRARHLPKDFADDACLLEIARSHHKKHADADEALFNETVLSFADNLRARLNSLAVESASSDVDAKLNMTEAARKIVEEELNRYEAAKQLVDELVDSPEEIARLRLACDR
jgi:hypothetical protein